MSATTIEQLRESARRKADAEFVATIESQLSIKRSELAAQRERVLLIEHEVQTWRDLPATVEDRRAELFTHFVRRGPLDRGQANHDDYLALAKIELQLKYLPKLIALADARADAPRARIVELEQEITELERSIAGFEKPEPAPAPAPAPTHASGSRWDRLHAEGRTPNPPTPESVARDQDRAGAAMRTGGKPPVVVEKEPEAEQPPTGYTAAGPATALEALDEDESDEPQPQARGRRIRR